MKKRSKKISKIVSIATAEERNLGEQTGRSRQHLDEQLQQLGELNAFRMNYEQKNPVTDGVSANHLCDYHQFLERLDKAVRAQQQIVRDSERALEAHRQRWMVKRQKLESLTRVLDRYRALDAAHDARQEQKQLDDLNNIPRRGLDPTGE